MSSFLELAAASEKLIGTSAMLAKKMNFSETEKNILETLKEFKGRQLTVVVAGEARRGKSSLLNALLGQQTPLFPVDINVCTNVATVVSYGQTEQIFAFIEDPKAPNGLRVESVTRDQIPAYVSESGNPNNFKRVRKLEARIPSEILKDGVVFVDTPGVGSLNVEHAETTFSYLPYADVLLFVTSANAPMTQTELDFLKRGSGYCDTILYPLTMMDLNANYGEIAGDNQKKIAKALKLPEEEVQVIPVSSSAKLRFLRTRNPMLYRNSNYEELEKSIWLTLAKRRGAVLLLPYLGSTEDQLRKLAESISAQYQVLGNDTAGKELQERLRAQMDKLAELQDDGAQWRNELAVFFPELQCEISLGKADLTAAVEEEISRAMEEQGVSICQKENYTALLSRINGIISETVLDVQQTISDSLGTKIRQLQKNMSYTVTLENSSLQKITFQPEDELNVQFPKKTLFGSIVSKGKGITPLSMYCGTAGTVIGAILGGVVGMITGGPAVALLTAQKGAMLGASSGSIVGTAKGVVDSLGTYDVMDAGVVRKTLTKYSMNAINRAYSIISTTMNQLRVETNASFEKHLKSEIQSIQEDIRQVRANLDVQKNQIPKKRTELKAMADALKSQMEKIIHLQKTIAGIQIVVSKPTAVKNTPSGDRHR